METIITPLFFVGGLVSETFLAFLIFFKEKKLLTAAYICMFVQIFCQLICQLKTNLSLNFACIPFSLIGVLAFIISKMLMQINLYWNCSGFKEFKFVGIAIRILCAILGIPIFILYVILLVVEVSSPHIENQDLGIWLRELISPKIILAMVASSSAITAILLLSSICMYCFNCTNSIGNQMKADEFWISFWLLIADNATWMVLGVAYLVTAPDTSTGKIRLSPVWNLHNAANGILILLVKYATPEIIKRLNRNNENDSSMINLSNGNVHNVDVENGIVPEVQNGNDYDANVENGHDRMDNIENGGNYLRRNVKELTEWHMGKINEVNGCS